MTLVNSNIKLLEIGDRINQKKWDDFVFSHPDSTFFHRAGWQEVIYNTFKHKSFFFYYEINEKIVGLLPLFEIKSFLFGKSLVSLPFAVYGGALGNSDEISNSLIAEAVSLAKTLGVDHLELRNITAFKTDWPTQDLYVTFKKELSPIVDENLLAIPRKQRAMVRKGIKNDLLAFEENNVNNFFQLYSDNVHRHGTPALPKKYFNFLKNVFKEDCAILTIFDKNQNPLSTVFSFYFKEQVLPYYAGDVTVARDLAANDFKYWELMRLACVKGFKIFDFGRSKKGTGSYAFKKNWGFEPTQLNYEYFLLNRKNIPQNNPNNKKFKLVISVWKKIPISLANRLGPILIRGLG